MALTSIRKSTRISTQARHRAGELSTGPVAAVQAFQCEFTSRRRTRSSASPRAQNRTPVIISRRPRHVKPIVVSYSCLSERRPSTSWSCPDHVVSSLRRQSAFYGVEMLELQQSGQWESQ